MLGQMLLLMRGKLIGWLTTWNLTTFLAVWGAVVATANALWSIRKDLRDKIKVKVSAQLGRIGFREDDGQPYLANPGLSIAGLDDKLYVAVSVTNVGKRPMRWQGWGGKYKTPVNGGGSFVVNARFLPRKLEEQEHLVEWTDLDLQFVQGNVKRLMAWDAAGNEWAVPRKDMKKLAKDIKKYADVR